MKKGIARAISLLLVLAMTACFISACGKTPSEAAKPTEAASPTEAQTVTAAPALPTDPSSSFELTEEQEASIAMLNYLAYTVQEINASRHSRAALEEAFDSLLNDIEPSGVDDTTRQAFPRRCRKASFPGTAARTKKPSPLPPCAARAPRRTTAQRTV